MTTARVDIIPAQPGQAGALGHLIATAFHSLAISQWLVPNPAERLRMQAGQFTMLVQHALANGEVYTTPDETAVAVWMPHNEQRKISPINLYDQQLAELTGPNLNRFESLDTAMDEHHPNAPHWYLAFLAVHPHHQRRGIGSALLHHKHLQLDELNAPAFLHASDTRASDLYTRHGYHPMGDPFPVGDTAPPMYPMWRDPRILPDTEQDGRC